MTRSEPVRRREHPILQNVVVLAYSAALWPVLPRRATFDASAVAGIDALRDGWAEVRREVDALLAASEPPPLHEVEPGHRRLTRDDGWKMAILRIYGNDTAVNLGACPVTETLLDAVPDLTNAMISVMEPGKHIPWHPGIMKGVIRGHLALDVPDGDCAIQVGRTVHRWRPGSIVLFDDTYPHRAWNRTDGRRVVLLFDVIRPMPWPWLDRLNRRVIARLGRSARFEETIARADQMAGSLSGAGG